MPTLTVGDTPIAYDAAGNGPPLLLLHAGIVDRRMWDPVWESLTARFHAVRLDLRGFGETPNPSGSHAHWRDAAALLGELEMGPVDVIGISMGASAALELALSAPELVRRLVLIAPGLAGWDWALSLRAAWDAEEAAYGAGDLDEVAWINVRGGGGHRLGRGGDARHRRGDDAHRADRATIRRSGPLSWRPPSRAPACADSSRPMPGGPENRQPGHQRHGCRWVPGLPDGTRPRPRVN